MNSNFSRQGEGDTGFEGEPGSVDSGYSDGEPSTVIDIVAIIGLSMLTWVLGICLVCLALRARHRLRQSPEHQGEQQASFTQNAYCNDSCNPSITSTPQPPTPPPAAYIPYQGTNHTPDSQSFQGAPEQSECGKLLELEKMKETKHWVIHGRTSIREQYI